MRCHYLSDLHLESQDFPWRLPEGDVLIIAGDLTHAVRLDPARSDRYSATIRERTLRFASTACARFRHVLLVAGNHDHYDGVLGDTAGLLRRFLPGVTVLDDDLIEIGGVRFFGSTLWSDMAGRDPEAMSTMHRRMGEYVFVKIREDGEDGAILRKLRPDDTADACRRTMLALNRAAGEASGKPLVVVTHHAPSLQGLNPRYRGNGSDCAYASDLDSEIARLPGIRVWVHGHTHVRARYPIGETLVLSNARGFDGKDVVGKAFTPAAAFVV